MSDRELMQRALEALELACEVADRVPNRWHETEQEGSAAYDIGFAINQPNLSGTSGYHMLNGAASALRARLAEPDDEPVAGSPSPRAWWVHRVDDANDGALWRKEPTEENVKWIEQQTGQKWTVAPLVPAARKAQPLTNEQIQATARDAQIRFCLKSGGSFEEEFARAIERAHGITGDSHD